MLAPTQGRRERKDHRSLSASHLTFAAKPSDLNSLYSAVAEDDPDLYSPAFFLASVAAQTWDPAVILIQEQDQSPVGILYTKERKLAGFRTGLFYADASLGSLLVARKRNQEEAFWIGLQTLLAGVHVRGLRMLVPPNGYEIALLRVLGSRQSFEFRVAATESHLVLPLSETYEQFLGRLGSRTRRNFRYYRNRSDNAGHHYVESISLEEFSTTAWKLISEGPTGGDPAGLQRALSMFSAARRPLLVGLRSAEGELISLIGGWYESGRAIIFMQINSDQRHAKYSLSLVARTHLIEALIHQGYREIVWWAGVGEPIERYCIPVPSAWVYLDRTSLGWRAFRGLINQYRKWLPARLQPIVDWVVPPSGTGSTSLTPNACGASE